MLALWFKIVEYFPNNFHRYTRPHILKINGHFVGIFVDLERVVVFNVVRIIVVWIVIRRHLDADVFRRVSTFEPEKLAVIGGLTNHQMRAVVVAQLVELSLQIPEVHGSNRVIGNIFISNINCQMYWKDDNKEKEAILKNKSSDLIGNQDS